MLQIDIPEMELFDDEKQEFISIKSRTIQLEHSLVSLAKWEAKWGKPFLGDSHKKTREETIDYIKCMTITQNVPDEVYAYFSDITYNNIIKYIEAPMTAITFNDVPGLKNRNIITAEIIYHGMFAQNIPIECQKWHLNRLIALIQLCNIKNNPPKKMGRGEMLANRKALNEARRTKMNSKG